MTRRSDDPVTRDESNGRYANYFELGYTQFEIILAFGQCFENAPAAPCHTRIITSPTYAKTLLDLLQQCLREYEQRYGVIETE